MGLVSGIVVYLLSWWVVLFAVLPWGIRRDITGKPENPRLGRKLLITSIIAGILWLIIYGLIAADIISFREMAEAMMQEDENL